MAAKKTQRIYEVSFHLIPTLDEHAKKKFEEIKDAVTRAGKVLSEEAPGIMALAYTIRHTVRKEDGSYVRYDEALFGSVKFEAEVVVVEDLRKMLQADEDVLRFLIVETISDNTRIGDDLPGVEDEKRESGTGVVKQEKKGEVPETDKVKNATMKESN